MKAELHKRAYNDPVYNIVDFKYEREYYSRSIYLSSNGKYYFYWKGERKYYSEARTIRQFLKLQKCTKIHINIVEV